MVQQADALVKHYVHYPTIAQAQYMHTTSLMYTFPGLRGSDDNPVQPDFCTRFLFCCQLPPVFI